MKTQWTSKGTQTSTIQTETDLFWTIQKSEYRMGIFNYSFKGFEGTASVRFWSFSDWTDSNCRGYGYDKVRFQDERWELDWSNSHVSLAKWKVCPKWESEAEPYYALYFFSGRLCDEVPLLRNRETWFQKGFNLGRDDFSDTLCKYLYQEKILKERRWDELCNQKCSFYGDGRAAVELWTY